MKNSYTAPEVARRTTHLTHNEGVETNRGLTPRLLALSLMLILAGGFFLVKFFNLNSSGLSDLLQSPLLLPLIVIAGAIAISASIGAVVLLQSRTTDMRQIDQTRVVLKQDTANPETTGIESMSSRILHLKRHAERLTNVEQTLARRMSDHHQVDPATKKLMVEIQLCTNRMLGHISEMDRMREHSDLTSDDPARSKAPTA